MWADHFRMMIDQGSEAHHRRLLQYPQATARRHATKLEMMAKRAQYETIDSDQIINDISLWPGRVPRRAVTGRGGSRTGTSAAPGESGAPSTSIGGPAANTENPGRQSPAMTERA